MAIDYNSHMYSNKAETGSLHVLYTNISEL